MKVSCLQENLARGLSVAGRAVSARSALPVLSHILFTTDAGRLRLSSTNLEMGIHCWIGGRVEEEGAIAVPARTIIDLINAFPPDRVDLRQEVRTMTLNVRCGRSEANIKGLDAVDFPPIPTPEESAGDGIAIDPEILRTAIHQVAFAAATDEARPTLTGVLLRWEATPAGPTLTLAAADGYRLAVRRVPMPDQPVLRPFSVIVPARTMTEWARICGEMAKGREERPSVRITFTPDGNRILFQGQTPPDAPVPMEVVLVSQLIPGTFPDYQQLIPRDRNTRFITGTAELLKACQTAHIFARENTNTLLLHIHPGSDLEPGRLVVSATSAETGSDVTELDAAIEGAAVEIAFNVKFILEALGVVNSPQVMMDIISPSSPGVIRPVGGDDFTYVVMPMTLER
ncbi:MAG: DNA polymerase III subunit beta [Anaerolineae bacterium]|nr:DNA polymerase III subunit beta [Anaerolineae bacterium]MDW8068315.1 DNA polymerase III subunit beta [Anaerolineae bacterium]